MRTARPSGRLAVVLVSLLTLPGCSLLFDWDITGGEDRETDSGVDRRPATVQVPARTDAGAPDDAGAD